tara:strand:- start:2171 stop:2509 length:339 start_codon:yes stop_codon:yes gene_type:complete
MSAWVLALGMSAGYLINKNLRMGDRLQEQVLLYQEQAKPADPGPTTSSIRKVQKTVPPADKYQDMNIQDLTQEQVTRFAAAQENAHQQVAAYEEGPGPIQGVYLNVGDRGVF